jgi:hypothetical protein
MAQHYLARNIPELDKVYDAIVKWFNEVPYCKRLGSIKYERIDRRYPEYRWNTNDINEEVYIWHRKIPAGIIHTSNNIGTFEIHYKADTKKILAIYFVA